jgi:hypothetical protein
MSTLLRKRKKVTSFIWAEFKTESKRTKDSAKRFCKGGSVVSRSWWWGIWAYYLSWRFFQFARVLWGGDEKYHTVNISKVMYPLLSLSSLTTKIYKPTSIKYKYISSSNIRCDIENVAYWNENLSVTNLNSEPPIVLCLIFSVSSWEGIKSTAPILLAESRKLHPRNNVKWTSGHAYPHRCRCLLHPHRSQRKKIITHCS